MLGVLVACGASPPTPPKLEAELVAAAEPEPEPEPVVQQAGVGPEPPPAPTVAPKSSPKPNPKATSASEHKTEPGALEVVSKGDHLVIAVPDRLTDFALIPGGVALSYAGDIWLAQSDTLKLRHVETARPPRSLVTDRKWLYWLGAERDGKLNLKTLERGPFRGFAPRDLERDLAMGDALYGLRDQGWVYRLGKGPMRTANIGDRKWIDARHLEAGDHVLAFPSTDPVDRSRYVWRRELKKVVRGPAQRIDFDPGGGRSWSMNHSGAVVFFRDGQVMRQARTSKTAKVLFAQEDLTALCWCGSHVCGISKGAGELRIHRRANATSEVIETNLGTTHALRCDATQVGWREMGPEPASEVHVVRLGPPPRK